MNPKLKTALTVAAIVAAFIGGIMLGVWRLANVFADAVIKRIVSSDGQTAVTESMSQDLPMIPTLIISALLFIVGWGMVAHFEYSNKTAKTAGFVIFLMGCVGILLVIVMAVISR